MTAEELSRELRKGDGTYLDRRRQIVAASLVSSGAMAIISLYQMGIIRHLPEPPLPFLDADRVDASAEAYAKFATPDAVLGLATYAVTAVLASMGGRDRARTQPWIVLALAAKIGFDAANALRLLIDQPVKYRAFCSWCVIAAAATFTTVPLVAGETQEALRTLRAG